MERGRGGWGGAINSNAPMCVLSSASSSLPHLFVRTEELAPDGRGCFCATQKPLAHQPGHGPLHVACGAVSLVVTAIARIIRRYRAKSFGVSRNTRNLPHSLKRTTPLATAESRISQPYRAIFAIPTCLLKRDAMPRWGAPRNKSFGET